MDKLTELLIAHEDIKTFPYKDTKGKLTIGVGHNLTDCGLSHRIIMLILEEDIATSRTELSHFDWFNQLDTVRQDVLVELNFNIGLTKLLQFIQTINAIKQHDFPAAAMHLLHSKWASDVGKERSQNMADRLEYGHY